MTDVSRIKYEFGKLKKSEELKNYLAAHKGAYLASVFLIIYYFLLAAFALINN